MKDLTKTAALAALMTLGATGVAQATEGWYGRVDFGYSVDGELDGELTGDGALGSADYPPSSTTRSWARAALATPSRMAFVLKAN